MTRIGVLALALALGWTAGWPQVSIYQWAYDRLPLGPGFQGHIFVNDTGEDTVGLVVELEGGPGQVEWLVLGGALALSAPAAERVLFAGRVVSGGLAVVALPEGLRPLRAAWITAAGEVPVDVESPIPRVRTENLLLVLAEGVVEDGSKEDDGGFQGLPDDGKDLWDWERIARDPLPPTRKPEQEAKPRVVFLWLPELAEWSEWLTYPYLVRLSAKDSFSPLGEEIVSWTWLWEDGVVQVGPEVVRGFNRPGWYRFTLVVRDASDRERALRWLFPVLPVEEEWPETTPAEKAPSMESHVSEKTVEPLEAHEAEAQKKEAQKDLGEESGSTTSGSD